MATCGMPSAPTPFPLRITVKIFCCRSTRNIRVVLKQTQLAFGFEAHAACGCIGDAAVRESQARIGDIDLVGKYAGADRIDRHHRRAHDTQDQIDVVNHQVEHHVDVRAAILERREPRRLDETRNAERRLYRPHCGIEALQVAHLQNAPGLARDFDEALPFGHRHRHRLLDQHAGAGLEKCLCDFVMCGGRGDDAHRIDRSQ